jgi:hypothetical protein
MNIHDLDSFFKKEDDCNFYTSKIPYGDPVFRNKTVYLMHGEKANIDYNFTYNFDQYGYRYNISKYNLTKNNKIFCFGCSHTMGYGIKFEDTWPFLLNGYFENHNIYNYGVAAISNLGIFRRVYQFIKFLEKNNLQYPEYIFIYFTDFSRDEVIYSNNSQILVNNLGPWSVNRTVIEYLKTRNGINEFFEFVRNFKLIEELCLYRNIKWYWSSWWPEFKIFSKELLTKYLKSNTLLEDNYTKLIKFIDTSRDNTHAGILTNKLRAKDFYEMVQKNI